MGVGEAELGRQRANNLNETARDDADRQAEVPQGRGLGLGLSSSLGRVRAHDGAIWAESAHGHGATFVFTMPRRDVRRDTMVEIPAVKLPFPVRKG